MFFIAYHSSGYQTDFSIQSSARASGVSHTFRTYSTTTGGAAVWNFATTQLEFKGFVQPGIILLLYQIQHNDCFNRTI